LVWFHLLLAEAAQAAAGRLAINILGPRTSMVLVAVTVVNLTIILIITQREVQELAGMEQMVDLALTMLVLAE
jgi:flagellar biogenesis protein FliO